MRGLECGVADDMAAKGAWAMIEFLLALAVAVLVNIAAALWIIAGRLSAINGTLSSVSHALIALAKERNQ